MCPALSSLIIGLSTRVTRPYDTRNGHNIGVSYLFWCPKWVGSGPGAKGQESRARGQCQGPGLTHPGQRFLKETKEKQSCAAFHQLWDEANQMTRCHQTYLYGRGPWVLDRAKPCGASWLGNSYCTQRGGAPGYNRAYKGHIRPLRSLIRPL